MQVACCLISPGIIYCNIGTTSIRDVILVQSGLLMTASSRVSFHTGTGNIVPRLVTDLTDFFGENKEFSMILGKNWNFKVVLTKKTLFLG